MKFFKKNPAIEKKLICVQGQMIDNESVLAGEEFEPFSSPKVPGSEAKLIEVAFKDLTDSQMVQVKHLVGEQAKRPPKHLGVIRSTQFMAKDNGEVQVKEEAKVPSGAKQEKPAPPVKPAPEPVIPQAIPKKQKKLSDVFTGEQLVDAFPGITDKNAKKIFKQFETLEGMSKGANSDFTKAGVQSNFNKRIRDKCKVLMRKDK